MKHLYNIIAFFILSLMFIGCNTYKISEVEINLRALKITESIDTITLDIFNTWEYSPARGGIWYKYSGDSLLYLCLYINRIDSIALRPQSCDNFLKDFKLKLPLDTPLLHLTILKHKSGLVRITGIDAHGQDILPIDNLNQDSIFLTENPFITFGKLNELKDTLNILCIRHYERLGGIIEFYLSPQHILTYIPDIILIDSSFRQRWINIFATGKEIKEHWNLRKLDKPTEF